MKTYTQLKERLLKDAAVKEAYDELGPEFSVVKKMIEWRIQQGITQAELAKKIGTKQSAISRFESGTYQPTVKFLYKVAHALGGHLRITIL